MVTSWVGGSVKAEAFAVVGRALGGRLRFLSLRGLDIHASEDGDLDFLVESGKAVEACRLVVDLACSTEGWYVIDYRNLGYLAQVVVGRLGIDGRLTTVKMDFFAGLSWHGIGNDPVGQRLFSRLDHSDVVQAEAVAFVTYIQKVLYAGRLREKDVLRLSVLAKQPAAIKKWADWVGMPFATGDWEQGGVSGWRRWRLRVASAEVTGLGGVALWVFRLLVAKMETALDRRLGGVAMGLSGLDGSGKSTQLGLLQENLASVLDRKLETIHLLPAWVPLPHRIVRRRRTQDNYSRPYAEPPVRSTVNGLVRLVYYLVAFSLSKVWVLGKALGGQIVVFDRSFADFSADLTRSKIPDFLIPTRLLRAVLPRGLFIFIDVPPRVVVARKGELTLDRAESLRGRYLSTFSRIEGTVIDGSGRIDQVQQLILRAFEAPIRKRLSAGR